MTAKLTSQRMNLKNKAKTNFYFAIYLVFLRSGLCTLDKQARKKGNLINSLSSKLKISYFTIASMITISSSYFLEI